MDFSYTVEEKAYRVEVKDWIKENVPGNWGSEAWPAPEDPEEFIESGRDWMGRLHAGGWAGINWPKDYGGREASPIEQFIFQEEMEDTYWADLLAECERNNEKVLVKCKWTYSLRYWMDPEWFRLMSLWENYGSGENVCIVFGFSS